MPHKVMASPELSLVGTYGTSIQLSLKKAKNVKHQSSIEPALPISEFDEQVQNIARIREDTSINSQQVHYAAIETAIRSIFYDILASNSIDQPLFCEIWNLFDIVVILSDNELCEPTLIIWLVEELLDSQTIDGCRIIFDYLESRRERLIAKHFKAKNLAILRACNELLRRLSRAEDTVFCGRVFIFLFQTFPLGDRSSVNLRGEFHVDNVTTYDETHAQDPSTSNRMDVDMDDATVSNGTCEDRATSKTKELPPSIINEEVAKDAKVVKFEANAPQSQESALDADALYPVFWSLQDYFSSPTRLFETANMKSLRTSLEATLIKFQEVQRHVEVRGNSKAPEENRRGKKRKRGGNGEETASSFNPKYLTSRDLFELEISDLAFRRHILVQALILIDFLLSLTPKSKAKNQSMKNKSVLYDYTLEEDDATWAQRMRLDIANYLQEGPEGKFYYRMVDTVLLRDKNWVRWKAENCPPFQRPSLSPDDFVAARDGAQKACTNKRMRAMPLGSLDLGFLSDMESGDGMEKFKDPARYAIPDAESLKGPIADDEFDASVATSEEDKRLATNARASKLWRMLRICYKSKFGVLDKIDDGNNLEALFEVRDEGAEDEPAKEAEVEDQDHRHPSKSPDLPASTGMAAEANVAVETGVK
ncbi:hypothetical protein MMC26_000564 [Xylographa opegraphella]|nr:hypothetical protein [Xylographa opegraphella]